MDTNSHSGITAFATTMFCGSIECQTPQSALEHSAMLESALRKSGGIKWEGKAPLGTMHGEYDEILSLIPFFTIGTRDPNTHLLRYILFLSGKQTLNPESIEPLSISY